MENEKSKELIELKEINENVRKLYNAVIFVIVLAIASAFYSAYQMSKLEKAAKSAANSLYKSSYP